MRILVTGATGQLGAATLRELSRDHEVIGRDLPDLDLADHSAVMDGVRSVRPDVVINCAAYTDVDGAEDEPVAALDVNAFGVRSLARAASETGAVLIHYSTDFVFSGDGSRPYTEDDPASPRSFYAASKLLGEWFARDAPRAYVLRLESLFGGFAAGSPRKSSVDRIADAIEEGREARVFVDRTVSPSYVADVLGATRLLFEGHAPAGLYHCVNSGHCTWYELAQEIGRQLGCEPRLVAVSVADVTLRAPRRYCALSNAKLTAAGIPMPTWQDAVARYLRTRRRP